VGLVGHVYHHASILYVDLVAFSKNNAFTLAFVCKLESNSANRVKQMKIKEKMFQM